MAALEDRGVSVHVAAIDIGAPEAGSQLREMLAGLPALRGVVDLV